MGEDNQINMKGSSKVSTAVYTVKDLYLGQDMDQVKFAENSL